MFKLVSRMYLPFCQKMFEKHSSFELCFFGDRLIESREFANGCWGMPRDKDGELKLPNRIIYFFADS